MTPAEAKQQPYTVIAVERACDILLAFREAGEVLQLQEIAERARLNRSTAFRLLANLVRKQLVERVGAYEYRSQLQIMESRRFRIGYAAQSTVVPFIAKVSDSIQSAGQAAGVEIVALNNRASQRTALRNADQFVRRGVDLVIEFQLYPEAASPIAEKLGAARIPMIALDNPHPRATYFGADNYRAGHIAGVCLAEWAAQNWQGSAERVLLVENSDGGPALGIRVQGVEDGLRSALPAAAALPVTRVDGRGRIEVALDRVRHFLRGCPANRILVGTTNDPAALGTLQAFRENGREEDCAIVGQGGTPEARHEMRRPKTRLIGSVAYFPETYGERLMPLVLDILNNRPVPPATYTSHKLLTPRNVNLVYPSDLTDA